jgi:hypothetical protein
MKFNYPLYGKMVLIRHFKSILLFYRRVHEIIVVGAAGTWIINWECVCRRVLVLASYYYTVWLARLASFVMARHLHPCDDSMGMCVSDATRIQADRP